MKIGINLASDPFRRDRPVLVGSAFVAFLMVVSLGTLIFLAFTDRGIIRRERQTQAALDRELRKVTNDKRMVDGEMQRPENAEVLERSVLVNELLVRKGISWTRIFSDLEKTLPPNVRVTQIKPQLDNNNKVLLEMTIAADTADALTAFLAKVEAADMFGSYNVSVRQAPTQTDPFFRYRMTVSYVQKF